MDKEQQVVLEMLDLVLNKFARQSLNPPMPVKKKYHRCLQCGKVTRYTFCPKCARERLKEKGFLK